MIPIVLALCLPAPEPAVPVGLPWLEAEIIPGRAGTNESAGKLWIWFQRYDDGKFRQVPALPPQPRFPAIPDRPGEPSPYRVPLA